MHSFSRLPPILEPLRIELHKERFLAIFSISLELELCAFLCWTSVIEIENSFYHGFVGSLDRHYLVYIWGTANVYLAYNPIQRNLFNLKVYRADFGMLIVPVGIKDMQEKLDQIYLASEPLFCALILLFLMYTIELWLPICGKMFDFGVRKIILQNISNKIQRLWTFWGIADF